MKTSYRTTGACIAWLFLFGQYIIRLKSGGPLGFAANTVDYLSYFTTITNIMAALAFTAPFLNPGNKLRAFFDIQAVRAAIALYISVVMLVYWTVLAPIHNPVGPAAITNVGMHLIVPMLYVFDWLLFAPKHKMSFKRIPLWTIYPVIYGLYTIARGSVTGTYPYPFLNVAELGMGPVFVNMLGFVAFYATGGAAFIALGRRLGANAAPAEAPQ